MQLYYTKTSPYARVVRTIIREKGIQSQVTEIVAQTRTAGSPYYAINPSGRVPYLVRDDGIGIEDSQLIGLYLDSLGGQPRLHPAYQQADWAYGRLETYARSMVDGISVWVREMRRPAAERSPTILAHEAARAHRLADFWEREVAHPLMQGDLNIAQLLLVSGLEFGPFFGMDDFRPGRPALAAFVARAVARPSLAETRPVKG